jgi:hypothetical protein
MLAYLCEVLCLPRLRAQDPDKLGEVCEMLHVTVTQLLRVHSELVSD